MSSITPSTDIPSSITTVEQLAVWVGTLLQYNNPTLSVKETADTVQRICQTQLITDGNGDSRIIIRLSVKLDPTFVSDKSKKFWLFAQEVSNVVVPTQFKSN